MISCPLPPKYRVGGLLGSSYHIHITYLYTLSFSTTRITLILNVISQAHSPTASIPLSARCLWHIPGLSGQLAGTAMDTPLTIEVDVKRSSKQAQRWSSSASKASERFEAEKTMKYRSQRRRRVLAATLRRPRLFIVLAICFQCVDNGSEIYGLLMYSSQVT